MFIVNIYKYKLTIMEKIILIVSTLLTMLACEKKTFESEHFESKIDTIYDTVYSRYYIIPNNDSTRFHYSQFNGEPKEGYEYVIDTANQYYYYLIYVINDTTLCFEIKGSMYYYTPKNFDYKTL